MGRAEAGFLRRHGTGEARARQARGDGSKAHFVSALVIAWPDGHEELFEGRIFGEVVWPPRGDKGFGYDPMFQPDGFAETFGEISSDEKHGIDWSKPEPSGLSHRARAFVKLAAGCLKKG